MLLQSLMQMMDLLVKMFRRRRRAVAKKKKLPCFPFPCPPLHQMMIILRRTVSAQVKCSKKQTSELFSSNNNQPPMYLCYPCLVAASIRLRIQKLALKNKLSLVSFEWWRVHPNGSLGLDIPNSIVDTH